MPNNASENASMEQVRELLLGTQFKDMENRILRQEERFMREIADLRDSLKTRVESLENFMKSESSSLLHRQQEEKAERAAAIKNEQRERAEALKAEHKERIDAAKQDKREHDETIARMTKELAKVGESFERKLTAFSAVLDNAEQELRQLLLTESSRLSSAMEEKYKDALAALSRTTAQLQNDLVSRSALSATFTEFAVKLAGDFSLSGNGEIPGAATGSGTAEP
ncbi:MAG: hypothetical protein LBU23_08825 [Planctomycetota bacterium]|nr:hypothetical protein [Planctomycetota bacterium]